MGAAARLHRWVMRAAEAGDGSSSAPASLGHARSRSTRLALRVSRSSRSRRTPPISGAGATSEEEAISGSGPAARKIGRQGRDVESAGCCPLVTNINIADEMGKNSDATGVVLCAALLEMPLLALHLYARAYLEPTIESSSDCKEPNARPGSRAEMSASSSRLSPVLGFVGSIIVQTDPPNPIYRVDISPRGATSAISAINFLMSKLPKELKSFATRTNAPSPPITLSR
jgi:hypothetical protein